MKDSTLATVHKIFRIYGIKEDFYKGPDFVEKETLVSIRVCTLAVLDLINSWIEYKDNTCKDSELN